MIAKVKVPSKWCTITIYVNGAQKHRTNNKIHFLLSFFRALGSTRTVKLFQSHCCHFIVFVIFFSVLFSAITKRSHVWWQMREEEYALVWDETRRHRRTEIEERRNIIVKTKLSNFILFVLRLSAAAKQYYMVEQTDFPSSALSSIWLN